MKRKKVKKISKKVLRIFLLIIFSLSLILYFSCNWIIDNFSYSSFDEILYTMTSPSLGASRETVISCIKLCFIKPLLMFLAVLLYFYFRNNWEILVEIKLKRKVIKFDINGNIIRRIGNIIFVIVVLLISYKVINLLGNDLYFYDYLNSYINKSSFIEDNYVNPKSVNISFPDKKRNLIYIYLESMEFTFSSIENGGAYEKNYISELTKLAKSSDSINFSNNELLGGALSISGTGWTMAGIVAQTSGLPLKSTFHGNFLNMYYKSILPGAYTLGEILEDNGYKNYMMVGSDISFAGRDVYLMGHGNYTIYDYNTAKEDDIIEDDYYVFWGMEDEYLFKYAKQELLEISKRDEPFNFSMLTVDTHAHDGFTSDFCENVSDNIYLNVIACSSSQVYEFVKWLKKQDFYENTTIVITGDHLSMNNYSFDGIDGNERSIYNLFINSTIETDNNKNRNFTVFDMFPSTLASLGVTIDGNKLGLGTNLFSDEKTLIEIYGYEYVNDELAKKSIWYDKNIMKNNKDNYK